MKIVCYSYEADLHCIACTKARHARGGFDSDIYNVEPGTDENNLPYGMVDGEGNSVHPVFTLDERWIDDDENVLPDVCGTCCKVIRT